MEGSLGEGTLNCILYNYRRLPLTFDSFKHDNNIIDNLISIIIIPRTSIKKPHTSITSKQIEVESPGCSGFETNLTSFKT